MVEMKGKSRQKPSIPSNYILILKEWQSRKYLAVPSFSSRASCRPPCKWLKKYCRNRANLPASIGGNTAQVTEKILQEKVAGLRTVTRCYGRLPQWMIKKNSHGIRPLLRNLWADLCDHPGMVSKMFFVFRKVARRTKLISFCRWLSIWYQWA